LWLNLVMSDVGQALFAQGYVRPAVPGTPVAQDVAAKLPNAPQVRPLDVAKAATRKAEVDQLWSQATLGK
ncbi:iron ABC transporter substrate-binding protein, partial [Burkholderia sp. GS2Y]